MTKLNPKLQCEDWNKKHPVGTEVHYIVKGTGFGVAKTRTLAFVTAFGAVALVFVEGSQWAVRLDVIAVIDQAKTKGASA